MKTSLCCSLIAALIFTQFSLVDSISASEGRRTHADLVGKWVRSDCQLASGNSNDYTYENIFDGTQMISRVVYYYTKDQAVRCSKPAYSVETVFDYVLRPSALGHQLFELDLAIKSHSRTPHDAAAAESFNRAACLGSTQWRMGQTYSVTDFTRHPSFRLFDFDLIQIQGQRIVWGDKSTGDASSPAKRPTLINATDFELRF